MAKAMAVAKAVATTTDFGFGQELVLLLSAIAGLAAFSAV
jgi:hypothetical protein